MGGFGFNGIPAFLRPVWAAHCLRQTSLHQISGLASYEWFSVMNGQRERAMNKPDRKSSRLSHSVFVRFSVWVMYFRRIVVSSAKRCKPGLVLHFVNNNGVNNIIMVKNRRGRLDAQG